MMTMQATFPLGNQTEKTNCVQMEGEVWEQDYKMKALVDLNKEGWVVKPLSACCVQLWLHAEH